MENEKKEGKSDNFETAVYIAKTYGNEVPDEIIIEIAKTLNMYPKTLLENYKFVIKTDKIFGKYLPEITKHNGSSQTSR